MKTNNAGIQLLKSFEGCKLKTYKDSVNVNTICFGHTASAGPPIPVMGMTLTQAQCEEILISDLIKYEAHVSAALTRNPNENQFAAYVSLCYNIGPGAFAKSSTVRHFNAGDTAKAANAILLWSKAGGKTLQGLVRRRAAEMKLFLAPVAAPATTLPPDVEMPARGPEIEPDRASGWRSWLAGFFK